MTREEAIKILKAIKVYECYPKSASEETKVAIGMAIEALSAEAVEVVRCRYCKYGEKRIEDYRCWMLDEDWDIRFSPMHFCSYGERREDGEA